MDKDEYYRDILEGLSVYFSSAFVDDVLHALSRCDAPDLGAALNRNQITGKKWLVDELYRATGGRTGHIYVLGGWYGVLAAMLLHDTRFDIGAVTSIDSNAQCKLVAERLNRTHAKSDRFRAMTADMLQLNYDQLLAGTNADPGDVLVNTSCEHVERFPQWYARIPPDTLQILQSNDYYACEEHSNCVPDLESFQRQAPMRKPLFAGSLKLKKYTRFMLLGYK